MTVDPARRSYLETLKKQGGVQHEIAKLPLAERVMLATHLEEMGMPTAFDKPRGSADFSRMAPRWWIRRAR